jgi:sugar phosphate isomerase/epimerase
VAEQIELIRSLPGLGHVEIWWEHGGWSDDDAKWLRAELEEINCLMHAPYINMSFVSRHAEQNEATLEILKRKVDQARILNVKVMTIHLGDRPFFTDDDEARGICQPYLRQLADYADGKMKISLENVPVRPGSAFGYPNKGEEVAKILSAVDNIYTTVDIGHSWKNNDDYFDFLKNNRERVADIHFHNVSAEGREHFGFNHPGCLDPGKVVDLLHQIDYQQYLTLEILEPEDIRKSWEIVKKFI